MNRKADNAAQKYDQFKIAIDVWATACDEKYSDAFKVGYLQSLAATMFAKLPKREREHFLAVLNSSSVHINR